MSDDGDVQDMDVPRSAAGGLSIGVEVVVVLDGELDLANDGRFEALLDNARAGRPDRLVLRLDGLRFIDARAIAVIAAIANETRSHDGVVCVSGARPFQRRLFEASGLGDLLAPDG